jgi:L-seryl-tRNA(Ser) seleniumtransferase
MDEVRRLLRLLTGAEDALVVNNNAAAVLLTLAALAAGREVIVSRGEAVEIGGGFRIPDVLWQSGASLVEVGTTNRTYVRDYAEAISDATGALLKVHRSNFRMEGFVHSASIAELAPIAAAGDIPLIDDEGSGVLLNVADFRLMAEPTIAESIAAGASVVTASGDKLLGGPQAGIIVGKEEWITRIARHPLARAVRADKMTLAGTAATLRHYLRGEATTKIPTWRMIAVPADDLRRRVQAVQRRLAEAGIRGEAVASVASVGGGALPGQTLPSWAIALPDAATGNRGVEEFARSLRLADTPVWGRIERGDVLLDLRSVLPEWDDALVETIRMTAQRQ